MPGLKKAIAELASKGPHQERREETEKYRVVNIFGKLEEELITLVDLK
jgi:hypothetical protein